MYLKTKEDIVLMRKAGERVARILDEMAQLAVPGISTKELDSFAESRCKELNCIPAFKGYRGFPYSVCISINEESIHGMPSDKRFLRSGDIVGLDFGVVYGGWYGDSAKTIGVGKISDEAERLIQVTRESLNQGISQCRPGHTLGDIGHAVQDYAEGSGFSVVKEFCGHGIGKALHEEPHVLNYGKAGVGLVLEAGMVLALEPMINAGKPGVKTLKDGWTVVTKDKSLSAHFEHTVLITPEGPEILTKYERNK